MRIPGTKGTDFWRTNTSCERADRLHKQLHSLGWLMIAIGEVAKGANLPILYVMQAPAGYPLYSDGKNKQSIEYRPPDYDWQRKPRPSWFYAIVDARPFLMDMDFENIVYTRHPVMESTGLSVQEKYHRVLLSTEYPHILPEVRAAIIRSLEEFEG